jgi:hypothetical protein
MITEEYGLLSCNAVQFGDTLIFQRNISHLTSAGLAACFFCILFDHEDRGDIFL